MTLEIFVLASSINQPLYPVWPDSPVQPACVFFIRFISLSIPSLLAISTRRYRSGFSARACSCSISSSCKNGSLEKINDAQSIGARGNIIPSFSRNTHRAKDQRGCSSVVTPYRCVPIKRDSWSTRKAVLRSLTPAFPRSTLCHTEFGRRQWLGLS